MPRRMLSTAVLASSMLVASLAGCASEAAPGSSSGAPIDPEALIASRCTRCHNRSRIDAASHDASGWARIVDRMVAKGARLSEAEQAALVEHLAGR
ncbi:MAG: hypothetical protein N3B11_06495 [Coriobacteriia bacterium]|nr:hypothetical protein [Coriobacteriia bacterium]